jgi:hypothetical protein
MFQRDFGGALVIWRDNAWTQIGIGSFSIPGLGATCVVGNPTGFARVTAFLTWIRDNTGIGV